MMAAFVKVAKTDEVALSQGKMVEVSGKKIALFNVAGSFYAIDDTCSHRGGPLSEGGLDGKQVTCPWHGAIFDTTTGDVLGPPAAQGVARYNVRVDGTDIEVEI
jgi:nitrite reductase (NADH) small subunit/3-phenylpropionate/trans-cinnamate dioxygenase ferredoxin subunit